MACHDVLQPADRPRIETAILCQFHLRKQPEFAIRAGTRGMDMDRLSGIAFVRIKMKSEAVEAEDHWHGCSLKS